MDLRQGGRKRPRSRLRRVTMPNTGVRILTVSELSDYLHVDKTTIYRALREGRLPGFRVGSEWRFHVDAIEQWQRDQMRDNTRKPE
jgi:excisionase family DNA binding protein